MHDGALLSSGVCSAQQLGAGEIFRGRLVRQMAARNVTAIGPPSAFTVEDRLRQEAAMA